MPITVILITKNEEHNLRVTLESVQGWADEIFVVDSGSTDDTVTIARSLGARVFVHEFETHAKQWEWTLRNLPIKTEWVLGLDADQRITPELKGEISRFITGSAERDSSIEGVYVRRRQIFRGKWIRHGGYYPKYLLKLFRMDRVVLDSGELVDHHFRVPGKTIKLKSDLIEDNRNEADISNWIEKHNRYAVLQAHEEQARVEGRGPGHIQPRFLGSPDDHVAWLKLLWLKMPLYLRPLAYFFYRYVIRLGFLDGKEGFIFHFMQAFWYRLLVDVNLDQLRSGTGARMLSSIQSRGCEPAVPCLQSNNPTPAPSLKAAGVNPQPFASVPRPKSNDYASISRSPDQIAATEDA